MNKSASCTKSILMTLSVQHERRYEVLKQQLAGLKAQARDLEERRTELEEQIRILTREEGEDGDWDLK